MKLPNPQTINHRRVFAGSQFKGNVAALACCFLAGVGFMVTVSATAQNLFVAVRSNGTSTIYIYNTPTGTKSVFASGLPPGGLACDSSGDLYVADSNGGNVYKVTPSGVQSTFASGFGFPVQLACDSAGDVFVADEGQPGGGVGEGSIIEITPGGVKSTFYSGLDCPTGLAFDSSGNLYEADSINGGTIYEYTSQGQQSVFASEISAPNGNSSRPYRLAFNNAGDLFEADMGPGNIFEFTPSGAKSTFATGLSGPSGLAFDNGGNLFEADSGTGKIYEFTPSGAQVNFASNLGGSLGGLVSQPGSGQNLFVVDSHNGAIDIYNSANGTKSIFASGLNTPVGLAFNSEGDLFVGAVGNGAIYEFTPNGTQTAFISSSGMWPSGLAFDNAGNLYVADQNSGNIYEFNPNGVQSTFASGFNIPSALAFDASGDLFVATADTKIFEFTNNGGTLSSAATLFASNISLLQEGGNRYRMAFNSAGTLFLEDIDGTSIYEFTPSGVESTFASGLSYPHGLTFDGAGDLFEADESGNIYTFTPGGAQSTFASGTGAIGEMASQPVIVHGPGLTGNLFFTFFDDTVSPGQGYIYEMNANGNVSLFASGFQLPDALAFDSAGDLFVLDLTADAIYEFVNVNGSLSPTRKLFASDLPNPSPITLAVNSAGYVFVGDYVTGTIYEYSPGGVQSVFLLDEFPSLWGMAFDSAGDLFLTDGSIYTVTPGGDVSFFANVLSIPWALTFDDAGNLFVLDMGNDSGNPIYKFKSDGSESTVDVLTEPIQVACDDSGDAFVTDNSAEIPYPAQINGSSIFEYAPSGARRLIYQRTVQAPNQVGTPEGIAVQPAVP